MRSRKFPPVIVSSTYEEWAPPDRNTGDKWVTLINSRRYRAERNADGTYTLSIETNPCMEAKGITPEREALQGTWLYNEILATLDDFESSNQQTARILPDTYTIDPFTAYAQKQHYRLFHPDVAFDGVPLLKQISPGMRVKNLFRKLARTRLFLPNCVETSHLIDHDGPYKGWHSFYRAERIGWSAQYRLSRLHGPLLDDGTMSPETTVFVLPGQCKPSLAFWKIKHFDLGQYDQRKVNLKRWTVDPAPAGEAHIDAHLPSLPEILTGNGIGPEIERLGPKIAANHSRKVFQL